MLGCRWLLLHCRVVCFGPIRVPIVPRTVSATCVDIAAASVAVWVATAATVVSITVTTAVAAIAH